MSTMERFVHVAVILLGTLALASSFMSILVPLMHLRIPAGAAQYLHFTQAEIFLRILTFVYFVAAALADLFIAIGFFMRFDKARVAALILAPLPFIGTVLSAIGLLSPLTGANYLLTTLGISFPALAPFTLPFVNSLVGNLSLNNLTAWHAIVNGVFIALGIINLLLIPFLISRPVKALFQHRNPAPSNAELTRKAKA